MLWRDSLTVPGNGVLSASSSSEALIGGAAIPTISPTGEQIQAVRQHAVLKKKRREVSTEWRRRAELQGRPYDTSEPQRTAGLRSGSFSASESQTRPRGGSLARLVVARRPGKSATTSSPSDSSEESEPNSPVRPAERQDNANPFLQDDTDEEETDEHGRRVVSFPLTVNVGAPEAELATGVEPKPRRRLSDIWKGLGCESASVSGHQNHALTIHSQVERHLLMRRSQYLCCAMGAGHPVKLVANIVLSHCLKIACIMQTPCILVPLCPC